MHTVYTRTYFVAVAVEVVTFSMAFGIPDILVNIYLGNPLITCQTHEASIRFISSLETHCLTAQR